MLKEPPDFIGNILGKLLNHQISKYSLDIKSKDWNMCVVLDTDFYPISIIFDSTIQIHTGFIDNPTLIFKMKFGTIMELVEQKISLLQSVLSGKVKMKGFFHHPIAGIRFYRLMNSILKG
jgi:hypothetical protein